MTRKIFLTGSVLAGLIGLSAWFGWRWYTTAVPPEVPLNGAEPAVVEVVERALHEVRRRPRSGEAWGKLAMTLAAHKLSEQAIACYVHAEQLDPDNPRWPYLHGWQMLLWDPAQGVVVMRRALDVAQAPEHRATILFRMARVLIENGELAEAAVYLHDLETLEANSPRVHFGLGLLAAAREDRDEARQHLTTLADNPYARRQACVVLANLFAENREVASAYLRQAANLPMDRGWPDPFEEEMKNCKVDRLSRIARFTELERQGRFPEALDFLRSFAAESPDAEVCFILGSNLCKANEFEEAAEALRAAIRFDRRNVKSHLFLGMALLHSGENRLRAPGGKEQAMHLFGQALVATDEALALQNDLASAHLIRGHTLKHLGRTAESLQAFRHAVLCQTENAEMHVSLGEALAEAGQLPEALKHLENAVRLAGPDDARPREMLKKWRAKAKTSS